MPQDMNGLAQLSAFAADAEQSMKSLEERMAEFSRAFSRSMETALKSGREFDDMLRNIALSISGLALDHALDPVESFLAQAFGGPQGAATAQQASAGATAPLQNAAAAQLAPITFNVQAADASSFAKSQTQIAAALARAVRIGVGYL